MPFTLDEDTVAGRIIAANAEARGLTQGLAQGRAEGQVQGRAEGQVQGRADTFAALIRRTFGDDPRIPPSPDTWPTSPTTRPSTPP